jgi:hypothetical protein
LGETWTQAQTGIATAIALYLRGLAVYAVDPVVENDQDLHRVEALKDGLVVHSPALSIPLQAIEEALDMVVEVDMLEGG